MINSLKAVDHQNITFAVNHQFYEDARTVIPGLLAVALNMVL
jgi:hypothetical protein